MSQSKYIVVVAELIVLALANPLSTEGRLLTRIHRNLQKELEGTSQYFEWAIDVSSRICGNIHFFFSLWAFFVDILVSPSYKFLIIVDYGCQKWWHAYSRLFHTYNFVFWVRVCRTIQHHCHKSKEPSTPFEGWAYFPGYRKRPTARPVKSAPSTLTISKVVDTLVFHH